MEVRLTLSRRFFSYLSVQNHSSNIGQSTLPKTANAVNHCTFQSDYANQEKYDANGCLKIRSDFLGTTHEAGRLNAAIQLEAVYPRDRLQWLFANSMIAKRAAKGSRIWEQSWT
jgi:hypothetical protein